MQVLLFPFLCRKAHILTVFYFIIKKYWGTDSSGITFKYYTVSTEHSKT